MISSNGNLSLNGPGKIKSEIDDESRKSRTKWIDFGTEDAYGKTCTIERNNPKDYELSLDETYCTNCRFADIVE